MLKQMILVFLGGAIGAAVRETMVLAGMNFHNHYPTAILAANLTAAFCIGLVTALARRVGSRFGLGSQWNDDLVSSGYWGLLKALRNRRSDAHAHELSAYVSKRVEGAVLDEARRVLGRLSNQADCDPSDLDSGDLRETQCLDWEFDRVDRGPEELADREGRWRSIERAIDHLACDHRELLLAYASGHSLAEIARGDGSSPARLQNQMSKITRSVRARSPELRRLLRHEV